MTISVTCPECGRQSRLPAKAAGRRVRCPQCSMDINVAADSAVDDWIAPEPEGGFGDENDDLTDFLSARPPGMPAGGRAATSSRSSRYRNQAVVDDEFSADCIIHTFDCDSDEQYGRELSLAIRDQLRKDGTFARVIVTEDPDVVGNAVTVEEGMISLLAVPGGMLKKATCNVTASAAIVNADGSRTTASASSAPAQGNMKQMLKINTKAVSTSIARETLKHGTGLKRLRQEISTMAIASLVFGLIGLAPFVAFVFFFLALIPAIVVLVYNSGRSPKVGMIRCGIGIGASFVGVIISFVVIAKMSAKKQDQIVPIANQQLNEVNDWEQNGDWKPEEDQQGQRNLRKGTRGNRNNVLLPQVAEINEQRRRLISIEVQSAFDAAQREFEWQNLERSIDRANRRGDLKSAAALLRKQDAVDNRHLNLVCRKFEVTKLQALAIYKEGVKKGWVRRQ